MKERPFLRRVNATVSWPNSHDEATGRSAARGGMALVEALLDDDDEDDDELDQVEDLDDDDDEEPRRRRG